MFYIHLVLGLHTFQHSVGRRKTNFTSHPFTHISPPPWNFFSLLPPSPRHQSHPLLTPFSPPFSPSPQHLSILTLSAITDNSTSLSGVHSTRHWILIRLLEITVEITGDYWKLLEITVQITGDYCTDYWRLLYKLLEITAQITGDYWTDYWTDYWRLLEITEEITGGYSRDCCWDYWKLMISLHYCTCATLLVKTNRDLHDICCSDHAVGLKCPCSYSLCCMHFHHSLHCYPHSSYSNSESIITCNCKSRWFHGTFYHGNWRALHHHAARLLVNIHITQPFCPPVSMLCNPSR